MAKTFTALNGAVPAAAAAVPIATGAAIHTHIQLAPAVTSPPVRIIEWWTEGDASAAATPMRVELIRHLGGPCTTATAYVAADVRCSNDGNSATVSTIQLGAALSGWGPSAEVTPTTVSNLSTHFVPPTSGIYIQYPLGREPEIMVNGFCRLRITPSGTGPNAYAGISWEE
jgi:hypothetical protein